MQYWEYIEEQGEIQQREELQEKKARFLPKTYTIREGFTVERVNIVKAIRTAMASMLVLVVCATAYPQTTVKDAKKAIALTPTQSLDKALRNWEAAKHAANIPALQKAIDELKKAQIAVKKEQREHKRDYDKYRTRYLRYIKANNRRLGRLNRQARGMAFKLQSMQHQTAIRANQLHRVHRALHPRHLH